MAVKKKYGTLGRGLDSLISTEDVRPELSSTINEIEISLIDANPNQPRREFDPDALQELVVGVHRNWHILSRFLPISVRLTMRM